MVLIIGLFIYIIKFKFLKDCFKRVHYLQNPTEKLELTARILCSLLAKENFFLNQGQLFSDEFCHDYLNFKHHNSRFKSRFSSSRNPISMAQKRV